MGWRTPDSSSCPGGRLAARTIDSLPSAAAAAALARATQQAGPEWPRRRAITGAPGGRVLLLAGREQVGQQVNGRRRAHFCLSPANVAGHFQLPSHFTGRAPSRMPICATACRRALFRAARPPPPSTGRRANSPAASLAEHVKRPAPPRVRSSRRPRGALASGLVRLPSGSAKLPSGSAGQAGPIGR